MNVHPILLALFSGWNRAGVRWCLLRAPADLSALLGDLDLLVAGVDLSEARRIGEALGFAPVPGRRYGTHLLQYDRSTRHWLWLHCVTDLAYGPYRALATGAEGECLARRQMVDAVAMLAPGDEFWARLLHCLVDRRVISSMHRRRLRELAAVATEDGMLPNAFASVCPPGWAPERVMQSAAAGDWPALEALAPALVERCRRRARMSPGQRAIRLARRIAADVRDTRLRRGLSVALLGPDGAGKSTLAAGLKESFPFPVRRVYMGLTGGLLRYVDRLRVPGVVRAGRLLVLWGRYLRAQYHQARGRLVIFDRYIYDAEVPPPYPLTRIGRLSRWIDGRACPPPDLVLVLDAPGAVMHQRKGEYTPEMLEDWRQRFLALQGRVPRVEIVDTTPGPEAVRADVLDRIWRRYAARWKAGTA